MSAQQKSYLRTESDKSVGNASLLWNCACSRKFWSMVIPGTCLPSVLMDRARPAEILVMSWNRHICTVRKIPIYYKALFSKHSDSLFQVTVWPKILWNRTEKCSTKSDQISFFVILLCGLSGQCRAVCVSKYTWMGKWATQNTFVSPAPVKKPFYLIENEGFFCSLVFSTHGRNNA